jgi:hypothetical protein
MFLIKNSFIPMKTLFLLFSIVLGIQLAKAQESQCLTLPLVDPHFHEKVLSYMNNQKSAVASPTTIYVPVVFHILHKLPIENIPDSLIYKQLAQLNRDFKRLNPDSVNTPLAFRPSAGKMDIEFCMANLTPSNMPTNGINRVPTTRNTFYGTGSYNIPDSAKYNHLGGASSWNPSFYLNIWVGNFASFAGFSAPPGNFVPAEDGISIDYRTMGTSNAFTNIGQFRTAVHEAGHFFGLKHIWGDDGGTCTGTDFMNDTPNQGDYTPSSLSCNMFPRYDACTASGNGVMFMNYMDYSKDACRNMFTKNQVSYMYSIINFGRSGLLSNNLTQCAVATKTELYTTETYGFSFYPNPSNGKITFKKRYLEDIIYVFDISGREVYKTSDIESNLSFLESGAYLIKTKLAPAQLFIKQ